MTKFFVVGKKDLNGVTIDANKIVLNKPSILSTKLDRSDIEVMLREENNLVLKLKNGETIILENFYLIQEGLTSDLVFEEDDCKLFWFDGVSGFSEITGLEVLLPEVTNELVALWPWLFSAGLIGGIIAVSKDFGKSKHDELPIAPEPILPPKPPSLKVDPIDMVIDPKPGDTVVIKGSITVPEGSVPDEVWVTVPGLPPFKASIDPTPNPDGSYNWISPEIPVDHLKDDTPIEIKGTAKDPNTGLLSEPIEVLTEIPVAVSPGAGIPEAPTVTIDNVDTIIDPTADQTTTLTGKVNVPAGSVPNEVWVSVAGGAPFKATVDTTTPNADGSYNWSAEVPVGGLTTDTPIEVTATAKDSDNGLVSDPSQPANGKIPVLFSPEAPTVTIDDVDTIIDPTADQTTKLTGKVTVPAGSVPNEVWVSVAGGAPIKATVNTTTPNADGSYNWSTDDIPVGHLKGDTPIEATATAKDLNTDLVSDPSQPANGKIPVLFSPEAPTVTIHDGGDDSIDYADLVDNKVNVTVRPSEAVSIGDVIKITVQGELYLEVEVTSQNVGDINADGIPLSLDRPAIGDDLTVTATQTNTEGLTSEPGADHSFMAQIPPPSLIHKVWSNEELTKNGDFKGDKSNNWNDSWSSTGKLALFEGAIGFDDNYTTATVKQALTAPIDSNAFLLIDLAWNNANTAKGGDKTTAVFSIAGVDLFKIETSEASPNSSPGAEHHKIGYITVMNGATVTIAGVTYQSGDRFILNSWDGNTDYRNDPSYMASRWNTLKVNLPAHLSGEVGDLSVTFKSGTDDIQVGVLKLVIPNPEGIEIEAEAGIATTIFSHIDIQDVTGNIEGVELTLTNALLEDKLYVQQSALLQQFNLVEEYDEVHQVFKLTLTEKSGVSATIEQWNSILSSVGIYSKNGDAHGLTVKIKNIEGVESESEIVVNAGKLATKMLSETDAAFSDDVIFDLLSDVSTDGNAIQQSEYLNSGNSEPKIDISALLSAEVTSESYTEYFAIEHEVLQKQMLLKTDQTATYQVENIFFTEQLSVFNPSEWMQNSHFIY